MAQTPEGKVKDLVKRWVKGLGGYYCLPVTSGYGTSGLPDFLICIQGTFVGIETKAPGRRGQANRGASALQVQAGKAIQDAGGYWYVVDSAEDLVAIEAELRADGVLLSRLEYEVKKRRNK